MKNFIKQAKKVAHFLFETAFMAAMLVAIWYSMVLANSVLVLWAVSLTSP